MEKQSENRFRLLTETRDRWGESWRRLGPVRFVLGTLAMLAFLWVIFAAAMITVAVMDDMAPHIAAYTQGLSAREDSAFLRFFIDNMFGVCLVAFGLCPAWMCISALRGKSEVAETAE